MVCLMPCLGILWLSCWYPLAGSGMSHGVLWLCSGMSQCYPLGVLWLALAGSGIPLVSSGCALVCLMVCYGYALGCLVSLINSLVSQLKGIDTMTQSAYNQGVTRCQNLVSKRLNEKERKDNDLWLC